MAISVSQVWHFITLAFLESETVFNGLYFSPKLLVFSGQNYWKN